MTVGIPRALLYLRYRECVDAFFAALGVSVVLSPPMTRALLDMGARACVNEACLPLKVFFGHVLWLQGKADAIFIPRLISIYRHEYICPKFGGLPDMVRCGVPLDVPILDTRVDLHHDRRGLQKAAIELGASLGFGRQPSLAALDAAAEAERSARTEAVFGLFAGLNPKPGMPRGPRILLLGHAYNLYDPFVNMNLIKKLQGRGVRVLTGDMYDESVLRSHERDLSRAMFWTFGTQIVGAAYEAIADPSIDGVICVTSFGCGPDAFIEDMAARRAHAANVPFLTLTIDEHSGEAGFDTRLEAFLDTLSYRKEALSLAAGTAKRAGREARLC